MGRTKKETWVSLADWPVLTDAEKYGDDEAFDYDDLYEDREEVWKMLTRKKRKAKTHA